MNTIIGMSARSTFREPKSLKLAESTMGVRLVKNNSFQRFGSIRSQSATEFYQLQWITVSFSQPSHKKASNYKPCEQILSGCDGFETLEKYVTYLLFTQLIPISFSARSIVSQGNQTPKNNKKMGFKITYSPFSENTIKCRLSKVNVDISASGHIYQIFGNLMLENRSKCPSGRHPYGVAGFMCSTLLVGIQCNLGIHLKLGFL